jgi:Glycosyl transferase 4-like
VPVKSFFGRSNAALFALLGRTASTMASPGSVLILDENLPVPFDRRVWNESLALRDDGYDVVVICPQRAPHTAAVEIIEGIRIVRHPMHREAQTARDHPLEYAEALWHEARLSRIVGRWRPPGVLKVVRC